MIAPASLSVRAQRWSLASVFAVLVACGEDAAIVTTEPVDAGVGDAAVTNDLAQPGDTAVTTDTGSKPQDAVADGVPGSDVAGSDAASGPDADAVQDGGSETAAGCEAGKPCDDGNVCTDNDACANGVCAGTAKSCDDQNACTTDTCDPKAGCAHANAAGPCDDGSACTEKDTCAGGKCAGTALGCDDGNPCTDDACDKLKGCGHAPNTAPCDDGNGCTLGDVCGGGACGSGKAKPCDDGNPCTKDGCDAVSGACAATPVEVGCDDGSLCTEADTCTAGACKGTPVQCDDKNACTTDSCDAKTGCGYLDNNALCNDGNACTDFDKCASGKCKGAAKDPEECDDKNPCTADTCDKAKGCTNSNTTAACDDGNPCTPNDACLDGKCQGAASVCLCEKDADCTAKEDGNLCNGTLYCDKSASTFACKIKATTIVSCDTSGDGACAQTTCDPVTGKCAKVNEKDGKACDADGTVCTADDACASGACKAGAAVNCDDKNACTNDSCDPKTGCKNAANDAACDADGTACTVGDQCQDKVCVAGKLKVCNDNELCTKDSCDSASGTCAYDAKPLEGQPCDADASNCTPDDLCAAGKCGTGKPLDCDDKNPCTIDKCDAKAGCQHIANAAACDADGDACTQNDQCDNKVCVAGPKKSCDDGDACTGDTCDKTTAKCANPPIMGCGGNCGKDADCDDKNPCTDDSCQNGKCALKTNSAACDDDSKCTSADACANGKCTGVAVKCNDGNACTDDACLPASGCTATANDALCEDGDACTTGDQCSGGKCGTGKTKVCDDGDACTKDTCNPADGLCKFNGIAGCGFYCNTAADCNDKNPCTDESCQGGKCVSLPNTLACDDANPCSGPDVCGSGKCNSGPAKNCNDNNQCTDDSCDGKTGACVNLGKAATATCDDGSACTSGDACAGKSPTGAPTCVGTAKNCDDANACTTDACNPASAGCLNTPNSTAACDDNNACSVGDICANGSCTAGNKLWVDTFAGSAAGFGDDKGTAAKFNFPYGAASDGAGNLYVADSANNRIRKVAPDGAVTTLAGQSSPGLLDGKGGNAQFNNPYGVAVDAKGDVWVLDTLNHMVRKVTAGGDATSIAGAGVAGFQNGTGANARFNRPHSAAFGPGGILVVADTYNHRIRRVTDTGVVTTLAGDGNAGYQDGPGAQARFQYPMGIYVDASGAAIVVDTYNHRIRKVAVDGSVTTVAGSGVAGMLDGAAGVARFQYPWGIARLADGSLVIADRYNHRLRRLAGTVVSTWAGDGNPGVIDGVASGARLNYPAAVAVDGSGYAFVADGNNHRVRRVRDATSFCAIGGKCYVAGAANPQNACQTCDPKAAGGQFTPAADGVACSDGDLCTANDACAGGACGAGKALDCDDKDACTGDACDASTGACTHAIIVGCGGNCAKDADCDDKNACTTDLCASAKCQNNNNTAPCDDGNLCTLGDACLGGKCAAGSNVMTSTFAGAPVVGNQDGQGTAARFNRPLDLARGANGVVYVTDWSNHNVRQIDAKGNVTTLAGAGTPGYVDGSGAKAYFNNPGGIEWAGGKLIVSDYSNHRLRSIDPANGDVTTIAGSVGGYIDGAVSVARFSGPIATATTLAGVTYIVDGNNQRIRKLDQGVVTTLAGNGTAGYKDGPGAVAMFNNPRGMAADAAGNLYVADYSNNAIRKVTAEGVVSTVAGTGNAGYLDGNAAQAVFYGPRGIAWDRSGTLTVADRLNQRIRRISSSGVVSTLAGTGVYGFANGNAAQAQFSNSTGVAVDDQGFVWVADFDGSRVRLVVDATKPCNLSGVCYVNGAVNAKNDCQACDAAKTATAWSARADGAGCSDGQYCTVNDACSGGVCGATNVDCDDKDACTTDACDKGTGACTHAKIIGCNGYCTQNSQCDDKNGCTTDLCANNTCSFTNNTSACDDGNACTKGDVCSGGKCLAGIDTTVVTVAGSGSAAYQDGAAGSAAFHYPLGVEIAANGVAFVADTSNHRIRAIAADGSVSTLAGSGNPGFAEGKGVQAWFSAPADLALGPTNTLYVVDRDNHAVRLVAADGTVTSLAGNGSAGYIDDTGAKARFNTPYSIAVTPAGVAYLADYGNHRIRKITPQGKVTTLAGSTNGYADGTGNKAQFSLPIGVGLDSQGNVYVGDYNNHRIRKVTPEGVVTTVAGSGIAGLLDGDLANARFQYPWGIAVGQDGAVYVADRYNHRVRKIAGGQVTSWAGSGTAGWLDGAAPQARFHYPDNVALDGQGWLWVADAHNHRIRKARATALSCDINKVCYSNGIANPAAPCSVCDGAKAPAQWTPKTDSAPCIDGDYCTDADVCSGGTCAGAKNACDDKDACTADACEAATGGCTHTKIANCP
ncbi:MAG: SMP-30/gluconolactonase/LRE family protein [Deltaproteobacteria bacterium]|nr:SMP-30/gluconolactonase/LRE family protein [Deltaproteobacteria bacterium]